MEFYPIGVYRKVNFRVYWLGSTLVLAKITIIQIKKRISYHLRNHPHHPSLLHLHLRRISFCRQSFSLQNSAYSRRRWSQKSKRSDNGACKKSSALRADGRRGKRTIYVFSNLWRDKRRGIQPFSDHAWYQSFFWYLARISRYQSKVLWCQSMGI